ncbi:hypothetical protein F2P81_009467 [Scophthalmus maximus]|uniref:Uncharacterized protein n=1 Tax=Scophthalmus maximus TaxID=52904 RepID=A0A6A4SYT8_SCOMX|nr:hypothetical protein F2P81_009467 [Scophthalmus maximus]
MDGRRKSVTSGTEVPDPDEQENRKAPKKGKHDKQVLAAENAKLRQQLHHQTDEIELLDGFLLELDRQQHRVNIHFMKMMEEREEFCNREQKMLNTIKSLAQSNAKLNFKLQQTKDNEKDLNEVINIKDELIIKLRKQMVAMACWHQEIVEDLQQNENKGRHQCQVLQSRTGAKKRKRHKRLKKVLPSTEEEEMEEEISGKRRWEAGTDTEMEDEQVAGPSHAPASYPCKGKNEANSLPNWEVPLIEGEEDEKKTLKTRIREEGRDTEMEDDQVAVPSRTAASYPCKRMNEANSLSNCEVPLIEKDEEKEEDEEVTLRKRKTEEGRETEIERDQIAGPGHTAANCPPKRVNWANSLQICEFLLIEGEEEDEEEMLRKRRREEGRNTEVENDQVAGPNHTAVSFPCKKSKKTHYTKEEDASGKRRWEAGRDTELEYDQVVGPSHAAANDACKRMNWANSFQVWEVPLIEEEKEEILSKGRMEEGRNTEIENDQVAGSSHAAASYPCKRMNEANSFPSWESPP